MVTAPVTRNPMPRLQRHQHVIPCLIKRFPHRLKLVRACCKAVEKQTDLSGGAGVKPKPRSASWIIHWQSIFPCFSPLSDRPNLLRISDHALYFTNSEATSMEPIPASVKISSSRA